LHADSGLLEFWKRKLNAGTAGFKVALAWAGSPTFKADCNRSLSLDRLQTFAEVQGVRFYSVQKGYVEQQIEQNLAGLQLVNLGPQLRDFADTAAVISSVDLVITTDTSVAHLAGALGRPTWLMLQFVPDWRWFMDRTDSPWYPTMRLFRQPRRGDWDSVIKAVVKALSLLSHA
jgi:hypothetical protein